MDVSLHGIFNGYDAVPWGVGYWVVDHVLSGIV